MCMCSAAAMVVELGLLIMAEPQPRSIIVAKAALQQSKWGLFHQLGSQRGTRVEAPSVVHSPGAFGPYGHNTLTGLYSTPCTFN